MKTKSELLQALKECSQNSLGVFEVGEDLMCDLAEFMESDGWPNNPVEEITDAKGVV